MTTCEVPKNFQQLEVSSWDCDIFTPQGVRTPPAYEHHLAGMPRPTQLRQMILLSAVRLQRRVGSESDLLKGDEILAKLIYSVVSSLDGFFEDARGKFDWAQPDEELHGFVNDLDRPVGTYLYGRRMYETMMFWETADAGADVHQVYRDFAGIWQAAEKIVYSQTLQNAPTVRTCIERQFKPEAVQEMKLMSLADIAIAGGELAGQALGAGLVDDLHVFLCPVVVGGGKRAVADGLRAELQTAR